jgi:glycine cleavage system H protein
MKFDVPEHLRYAETHEWTDEHNGTVRVGITDFAQDELGDIVFVDLPAEGETSQRGNAFGVIESIKAVSDLYAPVAGTVVETNHRLRDQPELVNQEPFGAGWLVAFDPDEGTDHLLTAAQYREQV